MKRMLLPAVLAACALGGAAAHAEDFTFSFFGRGDTDGTISGEIYGLSSSGYSAPTEITTHFDSSAPTFEASAPGVTVSGLGFDVVNNVIVDANYQINSQYEGSTDFLQLNYGIPGTNQLNFVTETSTTRYDPRNTAGFAGATYAVVPSSIPVSAAPEPSTWALMFAGVAGIGLMLRRARKTMGFRFKDALAA